MAKKFQRKESKKDGLPIYETTDVQDGYLTLDDATIVPRPRPEQQVEHSQNLNQMRYLPTNVAPTKKLTRGKLALITLPLLLVILTMLSLQIYNSIDLRKRMESISSGLTNVVALLERTPNTTVADVVSALGILSEDGTRSEPAGLSDQSGSGARTAQCRVTAGNSGGGGSFDDRSLYMAHGKITALEFRVERAMNQIEGLRVRYGAQFTDWRGGDGGTLTVHRFDLEENEVITGLNMFCGQHQHGKGVIGIGVTTNKGRNDRVYGASTDNIITSVNGTWTELVYLTGRSGAIVDNLDVHAIGCTDTSATLTSV